MRARWHTSLEPLASARAPSARPRTAPDAAHWRRCLRAPLISRDPTFTYDVIRREHSPPAAL